MIRLWTMVGQGLRLAHVYQGFRVLGHGVTAEKRTEPVAYVRHHRSTPRWSVNQAAEETP